MLFGAMLVGQAGAVTWEYAVASVARYDLRLMFQLDLPGKTLEGSDWRDLMKKAGCKKPDTTYFSMLNCMGTLGWELTTVDTEPLGTFISGSASTNYFFRRIKPGS
ncbi:hypothetical protein DEIPH_ctg021orf0075 [Deinococcus phoenicis]|uniref:Uncharacterized protein n=1 Tax=Deinococcus phoenicis TaxID=1476583 RepID=A0A016QRG7_9DEIO|nr:hypothetical protein DEIPH_ctg021orf0075 [Deinococcus phoenicis]